MGVPGSPRPLPKGWGGSAASTSSSVTSPDDQPPGGVGQPGRCPSPTGASPSRPAPSSRDAWAYGEGRLGSNFGTAQGTTRRPGAFDPVPPTRLRRAGGTSRRRLPPAPRPERPCATGTTASVPEATCAGELARPRDCGEGNSIPPLEARRGGVVVAAPPAGAGAAPFARRCLASPSRKSRHSWRPAASREQTTHFAEQVPFPFSACTRRLRLLRESPQARRHAERGLLCLRLRRALRPARTRAVLSDSDPSATSARRSDGRKWWPDGLRCERAFLNCSMPAVSTSYSLSGADAASGLRRSTYRGA